jgi:hypothetical protein
MEVTNITLPAESLAKYSMTLRGVMVTPKIYVNNKQEQMKREWRQMRHSQSVEILRLAEQQMANATNKLSTNDRRYKSVLGSTTISNKQCWK